MAFSQTGQADEDGLVNGDMNETPAAERGIFWRKVQYMEAALRTNDNPSFTSHRRENEGLIYELGVLLQPPSEALPGEELYPQITALMRIRDAGTSNEASAGEQFSRLWTYTAAVDEGDLDAFPSFLSNGRVWDSLYPLHDGSNDPETEEESRVVLSSYLTFPRLVLHKPGQYRIRIHLMRMVGNTAQEVLRLHSRLVLIHADAESETCECPSYGQAQFITQLTE